ncbi:protein of unknown function [Rhodovastum atsumiense]|nr:protein of unknown function [Rhodovastum atsumiense]
MPTPPAPLPCLYGSTLPPEMGYEGPAPFLPLREKAVPDCHRYRPSGPAPLRPAETNTKHAYLP